MVQQISGPSRFPDNPRATAFVSRSNVLAKYKEPPSAIYVIPQSSLNCGYYLPKKINALSGNTYTFIYERKQTHDMLIAPLSYQFRFNKPCLPYEKYIDTLYKYNTYKMRNRKNTAPTISGATLKRSDSFADIRLHKLMEIFNISQTE